MESPVGRGVLLNFIPLFYNCFKDFELNKFFTDYYSVTTTCIYSVCLHRQTTPTFCSDNIGLLRSNHKYILRVFPNQEYGASKSIEITRAFIASVYLCTHMKSAIFVAIHCGFHCDRLWASIAYSHCLTPSVLFFPTPIDCHKDDLTASVIYYVSCLAILLVTYYIQ